MDWKVRMVDDCKQGRQNVGAATSAAHRPADLDMWVLLMRAVGMKWPERLAAFTSDFKAAYRQLAACPLQAEKFGVAAWDPVRGMPAFGLALSQMFGSSVSPLNFSRYPDWCSLVMGILFGVIFAQRVDDLLCPERKRFITSAYRCWRRFADLCGWDIPDEKSPPPSHDLRTLGARTDLRNFPGGPILLRVIESRIKEIGSRSRRSWPRRC